MKDRAFKYIELVVKNWAVFLPMLLFMGSAVGWSFSEVANIEKDELTDAMKDQIEVLVDYKPKSIIKNNDCNCEVVVKKLIKKHTINHKLEH